MMNKKWVFFDLPKTPKISTENVRYWKNSLKKILKIGLEFEFNLPNNEGTCKGVSLSCPCVHFDKKDCWKKCTLEDKCKEEFGKDFEDKCSGTLCTSFSIACSTCKDFTLDCEACDYRYNSEKDPDIIREHLRKYMSPSKSYGHINASGVHSVVTDGSLLGGEGNEKGAEVITIGRRVDYWEFYKMISSIINKSIEKGAYVDERCSVHAHLLAAYYNNPSDGMAGMPSKDIASELERPMPGIILSNFHQLCRKFQNAITWMSMGLDDPKRMTRWEKFRISILDTSPVASSMKDIRRHMADKSGKKGGKYGWSNYMFIEFDGNEDITKFHVEVRPMDGLMSASAVTALSCLFYAMLLKAVEVSKYGLLEVGDEEWLEKSREVKSRLMNNTSHWNEGDRFSNTSRLTDNDKEFLMQESLELISQVKHILHQVGPAYEVLEKLAYHPISFRRIAGQNWAEIEKDLEIYVREETKIERDLTELIDLRSVIKCENEEEWVIKAIDLVKDNNKIENIENLVRELVQDGKDDAKLIWSSKIGSMLIV